MNTSLLFFYFVFFDDRESEERRGGGDWALGGGWIGCVFLGTFVWFGLVWCCVVLFFVASWVSSSCFLFLLGVLVLDWGGLRLCERREEGRLLRG